MVKCLDFLKGRHAVLQSSILDIESQLLLITYEMYIIPDAEFPVEKVKQWYTPRREYSAYDARPRFGPGLVL